MNPQTKNAEKQNLVCSGKHYYYANATEKHGLSSNHHLLDCTPSSSLSSCSSMHVVCRVF